jgi:hypothetical protein
VRSRLVAVLTLFLCLSGCVAYSGADFKAESSKLAGGRARLYIYRQVAYVGLGNGDVEIVHLDGRRLGRIWMHGFINTGIAPGQHTLTVTESLLGNDTGKVLGETSFSAAPGENIYFRYSAGYSTFIPIILPAGAAVISSGYYKFEHIAESEALPELNGMKQIEPERAAH